MLMRNVRNQRNGASFEQAFEWAARRDDYLVIRNGQNVRWARDGKMIAIKSNLDWTVISQSGAVAFLDTKTFQNGYFTYSNIDARQAQLALNYQKRGVVAGFVVHLRAIDCIVFFAGSQILAGGPRKRFGPGEGRRLGSLASCHLKPIFEA